MDNKKQVRTRFAPSPTGYMHIGNLRTALYAFLFARASKGTFILRIEDTDQKRYVTGAVDVIYNTLKTAQISHDEGPDMGGEYGPYVQSERLDLYKKYAHELVNSGHAYYCFCGKDEAEEETNSLAGYNRHCRNLTQQEIQDNLNSGKPYVIRQKMPLVGTTVYEDIVFGKIKVQNSTLEDQILLKSDGFPTYNFANVIDDHLMKVTHILRGSEFIPSTPKYVLLYESFGWEVPQFAHLPLIMGKDSEGNVTKLSKRYGATSFEELVKEGYLPEAIINYIALLGWSPKSEREIFSIQDLQEIFDLKDISKSPSIFDYKKLAWLNSEYIKALSDEELLEVLKNYVHNLPNELLPKWNKLVSLFKERLEKLTDINVLISDMLSTPEYETELLLNEKNKVTYQNAKETLLVVKQTLESVDSWTYDNLHQVLFDLKDKLGVKIGFLMWPLRIALTGKKFSPSATEYLFGLGKQESYSRIDMAINKINTIL